MKNSAINKFLGALDTIYKTVKLALWIGSPLALFVFSVIQNSDFLLLSITVYTNVFLRSSTAGFIEENFSAIGVSLILAFYLLSVNSSFRRDRKMRLINAHLLGIYQQFREVVSQIVDFLIYIHAPPDKRSAASKRYDSKTEAGKDLYDFLTQSCNKISLAMEAQTNRKCSVNIKLYIKDENVVETVARDQISAENRFTADDDKSKSISGNYPLQVIIDRNGERIYEYSNYAKFKAFFWYYHNENNERWQKHYNAYFVLAILRTHSTSQSPKKLPRDVVGFMCIDNFGGGFSRKKTLQTLRPSIVCISSVIDHLLSLVEEDAVNALQEVRA